MNIINRYFFLLIFSFISFLEADILLGYKNYIPIGSPLSKTYITSDFGYRQHSILKIKKFHTGVDLRAPINSPVYATADGVITEVSYDKKGYGKSIVISHNYGFKSRYAHLNKISYPLAKRVKKGDVIGYSGNTGMSTGAHLHYEVRFGNKYLNARAFIESTYENFYVTINGKVPFYVSNLIYKMEVSSRTAMNEIQNITQRGM